MLDDTFSLAGCMGMMMIDSVLYGVLMWYIEAVFPGQYGVPKPVYFFLTSSYWTGKPSSPRRHQQSESLPEIALGEREARNIEAEPSHLPLGKLTSPRYPPLYLEHSIANSNVFPPARLDQ